jgi:hypothetical protein
MDECVEAKEDLMQMHQKEQMAMTNINDSCKKWCQCIMIEQVPHEREANTKIVKVTECVEVEEDLMQMHQMVKLLMTNISATSRNCFQHTTIEKYLHEIESNTKVVIQIMRQSYKMSNDKKIYAQQ